MLRFLKLLLIATAFTACTTSSEKAAPAYPEISLAPKGKTFTDWGEFLLDSGDVVNIIVEELPQMNGIQKISPTGLISLPVIGMVRARGLTETQLREALVLKVRPHVKVPRVSLNIVQMNSYVIYFEGKVAKPGSYKLETRTTMQQAISLAGGMKEGVSFISLIRQAPDGTRKRYRNTVKDLKEGFFDNYMLERGDLIDVN